MEKLFWKNGRILADSSNIISPLDLGLIRGYGVFDFFRTYGKTPFELEAHFDRLLFSCKEIDVRQRWRI
jgi:branched-chain amino acid aminotransferase